MQHCFIFLKRVRLKDWEQNKTPEVKLHIIFQEQSSSLFFFIHLCFWSHSQKLYAETIPSETDLGSGV